MDTRPGYHTRPAAQVAIDCREARQDVWEHQGGVCAVCGAGGKLDLDHDHETGLIRGMLCHPCNVKEGRGLSGFDEYRANPPARQCGAEVPWAQVTQFGYLTRAEMDDKARRAIEAMW